MRFSASIDYDQRLWEEDIQTTQAHVRGLAKAHLLSDEEVATIERALEEAAMAFRDSSFFFDPSDEDIHSALERFLTSRLGDTGAKIHAGRSRNDLVVTDLRLWLKKQILRLARAIFDFEQVLCEKSREYRGAIVCGYTHLQRAQPVLLPHLLLAHAFALARDFDRMAGAYLRTDVSGLGAAAFAGTTLPLDPESTAEYLNFAGVFDNAADAVADRDFALEFLSSGAILAVHLSRLAEEIILFTSEEFGFAVLSDDYATGSSIMPQKKNPDVAELVRAKSARVTANLVHLLGVLKGLPLAYNRDLQEDKEPVFDTAECLSGALAAFAGAMRGITFNTDKMQEAASGGSAGATDLAEALVKKGVPFRQAHEAIGRLVALAQSSGGDLTKLSLEQLREAHPLLTSEMLLLVDPRTSVNSRNSHGGTSPEQITAQLERMEKKLAAQQDWLTARS